MLRFELAYVFVKTGLVGYMAAGKLQYSLTAQGVFERLLAHGAFAADEGPLAPGPRPLNVEDARHASGGARRSGGGKRRVAS